MKLTIVEKNLLSWTAMHIDFVMCKNRPRTSSFRRNMKILKFHSAEKRKRGAGPLVESQNFEKKQLNQTFLVV